MKHAWHTNQPLSVGGTKTKSGISSKQLQSQSRGQRMASVAGGQVSLTSPVDPFQRASSVGPRLGGSVARPCGRGVLWWRLRRLLRHGMRGGRGRRRAALGGHHPPVPPGGSARHASEIGLGKAGSEPCHRRARRSSAIELCVCVCVGISGSRGVRIERVELRWHLTVVFDARVPDSLRPEQADLEPSGCSGTRCVSPASAHLNTYDAPGDPSHFGFRQGRRCAVFLSVRRLALQTRMCPGSDTHVAPVGFERAADSTHLQALVDAVTRQGATRSVVLVYICEARRASRTMHHGCLANAADPGRRIAPGMLGRSHFLRVGLVGPRHEVARRGISSFRPPRMTTSCGPTTRGSSVGVRAAASGIARN